MGFYTYTDELYHWGVLGMKWGVRRYQNKDGTLTNAGKRRYRSEMEKLKTEEKIITRKERNKAKFDSINTKKASLEARKKALEGTDKPETNPEPAKPKSQSVSDDYAKAHSKRSINELTTQELRDINTRLLSEKQYYETLKAVSALTYKPTVMQKIANAGKKAIGDALMEYGTQTLKNATKAALNQTVGKSLDELMKKMASDEKSKEKSK